MCGNWELRFLVPVQPLPHGRVLVCPFEMCHSRESGCGLSGTGAGGIVTKICTWPVLTRERG